MINRNLRNGRWFRKPQIDRDATPTIFT